MQILLDLYNNKQRLSNEEADKIAMKLLDIGRPEKMNDIFLNHIAFQYYPNPSLTSDFLQYYIDNNQYGWFLDFFKSIEKSYYIAKSTEFYNKAINFALKNNDKKTVVDLFLSIINYENVKLAKLPEIIYSNKFFLKDQVFYDYLKEYMNTHKDSLTVGSCFATLCYNLYNKADETEINTHLERLNTKIRESENSKAEIFYNREIKIFLRSLINSDIIKNIDSKVIHFMNEDMKIDLLDEKEKEVQEPEEQPEPKFEKEEKKSIVKKAPKEVEAEPESTVIQIKHKYFYKEFDEPEHPTTVEVKKIFKDKDIKTQFASNEKPAEGKDKKKQAKK